MLIRLNVSRVTLRQSVDVGTVLLRRFRRQLDSFLQITVSLQECWSARWDVVIRTHGERDAPVGHGHLWIELCRLFEGAHSFFVIEREDIRESLVEKFLSFGVVCCYGVVNVAESCH